MSELTPAELFNKHAHTYSEKFMDVSQYADGLDIFCGYLPTDAVILDVACGPGNIARYIQDKMPMAMLTGIDMAPDMLDIARTVVPTGKFLLMDCGEIGSLAQTYDGIVCAFLLPYLGKSNALALVQACTDMLNRKGVLYLSFMEGANADSHYTTNSAGDTVFLNYHEVAYITDVLTVGGCDIINSSRMPSPSNASVQTNDVVLVAVKK
jgi:2-polyprenyl-3-methyl-5-hydroxy-6-metoxy-1,4-benzoquinol methylase